LAKRQGSEIHAAAGDAVDMGLNRKDLQQQRKYRGE
jgi:hypothetical protein